MDDRKRLLNLAKENGVDIHHSSGLQKIQEALIDAGIEFDLVDTPSERPPAPDEVTEPVAEDTQSEVERLRAELAKAQEREAAMAAERKASAATSEGLVECVVLKKFHIQRTDLGMPDTSGQSVRVTPQTRIKLRHSLAEMLSARGQVAIVS